MHSLLVCVFVVTVPVVATAAPTDDQLDPSTARTLSIVGTAIPIGAVALGFSGALDGFQNANRDVDGGLVVVGVLTGVLTPSIGQIYARRILSRGLGVRVLGFAILGMGVIRYAIQHDGCEGAECDANYKTWGLIAAGSTLYLGGAVLDIVDAPNSVVQRNTHHLGIAPSATTSDGHRVTGLVLTGTF